MTEGQGCWGSLKKPITSLDLLYSKRLDYIDRFHNFGWPKQVAKELGFDKLYNLGMLGSSTSGQLKHFLNYAPKGEDTYVIWMLTEPTRFSFYKGGVNIDINPRTQSDLGDSYLDFIEDTTLDGTLEQLFYIKCMREICEARNYKLLLTYWTSACALTQLMDERNDQYLTPTPKNIFIPRDQPEYRSTVCNHPNEKGYEYMAKELLHYVNLNHSTFRIGPPVKDVQLFYYPYKKHIKTDLLI